MTEAYGLSIDLAQGKIVSTITYCLYLQGFAALDRVDSIAHTVDHTGRVGGKLRLTRQLRVKLIGWIAQS